ncbi:MAG: UDP-N-acetylmuramoyl-tripeptide--D-alanyl-D-alanine ligase [Oscillospiraceae bacterium]|nr:UDP-N-acetylmuramoyl-tripeptide--D-alanyl-D-alanine ligase [Oscillospiraceae bacterium]
MKQLTPEKIAEITNGEYIGTDKDKTVPIKGAVRDNRDVKPGNLFICIKGAKADGHDFINSAFESGAVCCLTEIKINNAKGPYVLVTSTLEAIKQIGAYYRSLFDIPVIGITGSVGKTTAKEIIAAVLSEKYCVLKTEMNLNNELGVPLTLLTLEEKHEAAVIEMGISDFGEMSRLAQMVRPDIFVMTKIGYAHIEELGDLQGVLKAKTEAFEYMKPTGTAVLNGDDELLNGYDPKMRKITFGLEKHNDIRALNIQSNGIESIELDIESEQSRFHIKIPAYGSHISSLAPAAVAVGQLLGMNEKEIQNGFLKYLPVEGRSRVSNLREITVIDDCYNANPNSVKAALTSISALPGRHVAILGDMLSLGEHSEQMHREIGIFAAQSGIDVLLCHGEKARFFYEGFLSADTGNFNADDVKVTDNEKNKKSNKQAYYFPQLNDLITKIQQTIEKGDAVLIKASRGMQFDKLLPVIYE